MHMLSQAIYSVFHLLQADTPFIFVYKTSPLVYQDPTCTEKVALPNERLVPAAREHDPAYQESEFHVAIFQLKYYKLYPTT